MAERRMFSKKITDTDAFLAMPLSSQALYFHLSLHADDEGFVGNPKTIQRTIGATDDDLRILLAKRFLLSFDSGIVVIKHWYIHNYLQNDRIKPTTYLEEKALLTLDAKRSYTEKNGNEMTMYTKCIQNGYVDKNSIDKNSIVEYSIEESTAVDTSTASTSKHKHGEYKHVLLTDDELSKLNTEYGTNETQEAIKYLDEYIEMKGAKYKSHYLALKKWVYTAVKEKSKRNTAVADDGLTETQRAWLKQYEDKL